MILNALLIVVYFIVSFIGGYVIFDLYPDDRVKRLKVCLAFIVFFWGMIYVVSN